VRGYGPTALVAETSYVSNTITPRGAIESTRTWSSVEVVAEAIALASKSIGLVYVERLGDDLFRWSPAHKGGAYPLTRIVAKFLEVDYKRIYIGFRTVDGAAVLCDDPANVEEPTAWCFLNFDGSRKQLNLTDVIRRELV
jgi:hypothetical protein